MCVEKLTKVSYKLKFYFYSFVYIFTLNNLKTNFQMNQIFIENQPNE